MSDRQCRMTTTTGTQCDRMAPLGGVGFCWQHMPAKKSDKEAWKKQIEAGIPRIIERIVLKLLENIIELAIDNLTDLFGEGDPEQATAMGELSQRFPFRYPELPNSHTPGTRVVDWIGLQQIINTAEHIVSGTKSQTRRH